MRNFAVIVFFLFSTIETHAQISDSQIMSDAKLAEAAAKDAKKAMYFADLNQCLQSNREILRSLQPPKTPVNLISFKLNGEDYGWDGAYLYTKKDLNPIWTIGDTRSKKNDLKTFNIKEAAIIETFKKVKSQQMLLPASHSLSVSRIYDSLKSCSELELKGNKTFNLKTICKDKMNEIELKYPSVYRRNPTTKKQSGSSSR